MNAPLHRGASLQCSLGRFWDIEKDLRDLRDAEIDAFSRSAAEHRAASLALEDLVKVLRTGDDTRLTSLCLLQSTRVDLKAEK